MSATRRVSQTYISALERYALKLEGAMIEIRRLAMDGENRDAAELLIKAADFAERRRNMAVERRAERLH